MAEESAAEAELETRIESIVERVLERHLQRLPQPSSEAGEPSRRATGGELHYCTSLPYGMTSRRRALTKEIGTGAGRQAKPAGPTGRRTGARSLIGTGAGRRTPGNYERDLSAGGQARTHHGTGAGQVRAHLSADGWARVLRAPGLATISHRLAGAECPTFP